MCYYAEWDERFQQAAKELRKSKVQAEQMMGRAKQARMPERPDTTKEPAKESSVELDESIV